MALNSKYWGLVEDASRENVHQIVIRNGREDMYAWYITNTPCELWNWNVNEYRIYVGLDEPPLRSEMNEWSVYFCGESYYYLDNGQVFKHQRLIKTYDELSSPWFVTNKLLTDYIKAPEVDELFIDSDTFVKSRLRTIHFEAEDMTTDTLLVKKHADVQELDVVENTNIGGKLDVSDKTNLKSTLDVEGDTTLDSKLIVNGQTYLNDNLNVGTSSKDVDSNFFGNINLEGTENITGEFNVKGESTFTGDVTVTKEGNLTLENPLKPTSGGTGRNNLKDSCNDLINALDPTPASIPTDGANYISQYFDGSKNTYHRTPHSYLWGYIKKKLSDVFNIGPTKTKRALAIWKDKDGGLENTSVILTENSGLEFPELKTTDSRVLIDSPMATNDRFRLKVGGNAIDKGFVEFATAKDGNEPVYFKQYSDSTFKKVNHSLTLLDEYGNTDLAGSVTSDGFNKRYTVIDLTGSSYNQDYFYPCTVPLDNTTPGSFVEIECYTYLNYSGKPNWCNHPSGFSAHLHLLTTSSGWGTTLANTIVLDSACYWVTSGVTPIGWTQMTNSSTGVLWLRGGGKYYVYNNKKLSFTVRTSTFKPRPNSTDTQSVSPTTDRPFSFVKSKIYANLNGNASSASELLTARKINNTDFDGTTDITTASWGTARTLKVTDFRGGFDTAGSSNVGSLVLSNFDSSVTMDGSKDVELRLPKNLHTDTLMSNKILSESAQFERSPFAEINLASEGIFTSVRTRRSDGKVVELSSTALDSTGFHVKGYTELDTVYTRKETITSDLIIGETDNKDVRVIKTLGLKPSTEKLVLLSDTGLKTYGTNGDTLIGLEGEINLDNKLKLNVKAFAGEHDLTYSVISSTASVMDVPMLCIVGIDFKNKAEVTTKYYFALDFSESRNETVWSNNIKVDLSYHNLSPVVKLSADEFTRVKTALRVDFDADLIGSPRMELSYNGAKLVKYKSNQYASPFNINLVSPNGDVICTNTGFSFTLLAMTSNGGGNVFIYNNGSSFESYNDSSTAYYLVTHPLTNVKGILVSLCRGSVSLQSDVIDMEVGQTLILGKSLSDVTVKNYYHAGTGNLYPAMSNNSVVKYNSNNQSITAIREGTVYLGTRDSYITCNVGKQTIIRNNPCLYARNFTKGTSKLEYDVLRQELYEQLYAELKESMSNNNTNQTDTNQTDKTPWKIPTLNNTNQTDTNQTDPNQTDTDIITAYRADSYDTEDSVTYTIDSTNEYLWVDD